MGDGWRSVLLASAAAEVERVGDALGAGARVSERDAHSGFVVPAAQDVGPVAGTLHPSLDDLTWRAELSRSPGEVLAEGREQPRPHVPSLANPVDEAAAAESVVREVALDDHVVGMAAGCPRESAVGLQRLETARSSF